MSILPKPLAWLILSCYVAYSTSCFFACQHLCCLMLSSCLSSWLLSRRCVLYCCPYLLSTLLSDYLSIHSCLLICLAIRCRGPWAAGLSLWSGCLVLSVLWCVVWSSLRRQITVCPAFPLYYRHPIKRRLNEDRLPSRLPVHARRTLREAVSRHISADLLAPTLSYSPLPSISQRLSAGLTAPYDRSSGRGLTWPSISGHTVPTFSDRGDATMT